MRRPVFEILWFGALAACCAVMGGLLISGDVLLYLAPRLVKWVWFGFIALIILALYQFSQVRLSLGLRRHETSVRLNSLVFLIPVVLFFTVMPNQDTTSTLPNQNVQMGITGTSANSSGTKGGFASSSQSASPAQTSATAAPTQTASTSSPTPSPSPSGAGEETGTPTEASSQTIDVADAAVCVPKSGQVEYSEPSDYFPDYIFYSTEELSGKSVMLYGFVYTDDSFPKDTILVARKYISCCAADASIVGFYVKVKDPESFTPGQWICVNGTMQTISVEYYGEDQDFPILTGGTIQNCSAPGTDDAYIYPY